MYLIRCLLSQYQEWKNYTPIKALSIKPVVVFDHVGDPYAPATGIVELFEREKEEHQRPVLLITVVVIIAILLICAVRSNFRSRRFWG